MFSFSPVLAIPELDEDPDHPDNEENDEEDKQTTKQEQSPSGLSLKINNQIKTGFQGSTQSINQFRLDKAFKESGS